MMRTMETVSWRSYTFIFTIFPQSHIPNPFILFFPIRFLHPKMAEAALHALKPLLLGKLKAREIPVA